MVHHRYISWEIYGNEVPIQIQAFQNKKCNGQDYHWHLFCCESVSDSCTFHKLSWCWFMFRCVLNFIGAHLFLDNVFYSFSYPSCNLRDTQTNGQNQAVDKSMMKLFFVVAISHLVLVGAFYFRIIYFAIQGVSNLETFRLSVAVARTLVISNYTLNFYFYLMVSPKFRANLKRLLQCK